MDISFLPKKSLSQSVLDSSLDPLQIFDVSHLYSENTKYNTILQNREFFALNGAVFNVYKMPPLEYLERCAKGFHTSIQNNIDILRKDSILRYINQMRRGVQKFPLPILVYNHVRHTFLQEGRHRAVAAYYLELEYIPVVEIHINTQDVLNIIDNGWFESNPNKY